MKKMRVFLPIIVALVGVFFFTQCKKDHSCKMRLTCYYSSNGMDAVSGTSDVTYMPPPCSMPSTTPGPRCRNLTRPAAWTLTPWCLSHSFPSTR